jgi:autotransporter adhesin
MITNVAAGVDATDAVNVSQLQNIGASTLASANAYTNKRIEDLSEKAHRGIAGAIAMSRAFLPLNAGESGVAVGFGVSGSQGAIALSLQHQTTERIHFNVGASFSESGVQAGGGLGIKF